MGKKEVVPVREGELYDLSIDGYGSDGAGVGRVEGQVVFVKDALRGERCRVRIEHIGHRAAWGRIETILAPSPERVTPDCPYYKNCGGCQTRHMSYAEELRFKADKIRDALTRIGRLEVEEVPVAGAANALRYRNKVQFPIAAGPDIGFYRERSHRVLNVEDCQLQPPICADIRKAVWRYMVRFQVPAYDQQTATGLLRHLYIRTNQAGEALVCLLVNGDALPQEEELVQGIRDLAPAVRGVLLGVNLRRDNVILGERYRTLWGEDLLPDTLRGLTFQLSVPSFYQVNRDQAEVLYGFAAQFAQLTGEETLLDLYCGAGTIGLTLAGQVKELMGVDIVPQAIKDARENARRNGIGNAQFFAADAGEIAQTFAQEGRKPHVIVVDPPRKGLSQVVIDAILTMAPDRLVYVSCDPATLARDLKLLCKDYELRKVQGVDLFPRTFHVETVVLLTRR